MAQLLGQLSVLLTEQRPDPRVAERRVAVQAERGRPAARRGEPADEPRLRRRERAVREVAGLGVRAAVPREPARQPAAVGVPADEVGGLRRA